MKNKKTHGIHITHNDSDAIGCALVLATYYTKFDFEDNTYFCAIGSQDEVLMNVLTKDIEENNVPEFIVISDIFLKEETCEYLEKVSREYNITLLGIDHHKTNNLNDKYDWFKVYKDRNFDDVRFPDGVNVSAAWAMMNYISTVEDVTPPSTLSLLIDMISRYDTWEWKYHPYNYVGTYAGVKEDVVAVICSFMGPEKTFNELYDLYSSTEPSSYLPSSLKKGNPKIRKLFPDLFKTIYTIEKDKEKRYLDKLEKKIKIVDLFKYTVAMIICENGYTNEAADYIGDNFKFVDMTIILYPAANRIGFRTKSNKIDVALFAEKYFNGGGHPKASGANVDCSTMSSLMELYYIIGDTIDDYCEDNELMKGDTSC